MPAKPPAELRGTDGWSARHNVAGTELDVDPPTSSQTQKAQYAAIIDWRKIKGERFAELKTIKQPTLIVNGSNDIMVPTENSWIMSQHIRRAQLIVYPDSGHAAHYQYPELFLQHSRIFLDS